jgi:ADP-heptose:LPS heptosyltransferase
MKILIIKLGALGDVIASTSIIKQIIEHHGNEDVSLLTGSNFNDLFSHFEKLKVFSINRKGLINTIKTIFWIRKQNFDHIYDLQSNDRTTVYCALSGSSFRAGNHPRFPYHAHPKNEYLGECHSFDRLNQILESANIKPAKALPFLPIKDQTITEVSTWLKKHEVSEEPFALLHAGSSPLHLKKRWPYFSELARYLSKTLKIIWIGGSDDVELNKALSHDIGINATNAFNIPSLVELGKRARFAVTNDSAPMHILSCSQIPVFGLFGPTYARRTHALGQLNNVITPSNLIALNDHDFTPENISKISVKQVLNKLIEQNLL